MNTLARIIGILLLGTIGTAGAAEWKMDPADSKLEFIATYEKAPAPGNFKEFDTQLRFDPAKPAGSELRVTVKIASADLGNSDMNEAVRDPEWFDLKKFPDAVFLATDIRRSDGGRFVAHGKLRIKGIEKDVSVPFAWAAAGDGAVMEGELTLTRTDFSVGTGDWSKDDTVALDVKVKFKVKLRKAS
jgi:polyisoprenoid-binding protein YceI